MYMMMSSWVAGRGLPSASAAVRSASNCGSVARAVESARVLEQVADGDRSQARILLAAVRRCEARKDVERAVVEMQFPGLDQLHDRDRGKRFAGARDPEPVAGRCRDLRSQIARAECPRVHESTIFRDGERTARKLEFAHRIHDEVVERFCRRRRLAAGDDRRCVGLCGAGRGDQSNCARSRGADKVFTLHRSFSLRMRRTQRPCVRKRNRLPHCLHRARRRDRLPWPGRLRSPRTVRFHRL